MNQRIIKWISFLTVIGIVIGALYFFFGVSFEVLFPLLLAGPTVFLATVLVTYFIDGKVDITKHEFSPGADLTSNLTEDKYIQGILATFLLLIYTFLAINIPLFENSAVIYAVLAAWGGIIAPLLLTRKEIGAASFLGVLGTDKRKNLTMTFFVSAIAAGVWAGYTTLLAFIAPSALSMPLPSEEVLLYAITLLWVLTAVFTEEFLFRSTEGAWFCNVLGIIPGAVVSAIMFAGFHWAVYRTVAVAGVYLFVMGLFIMILDVHRQSSMPGIVVHFVNNFNATTAMLVGVGQLGASINVGIGLGIAFIFGFLGWMSK